MTETAKPPAPNRFAAGVALVAWLGLTLQFWLAIPARMAAGYSLLAALLWFFSFFTVLTNLAAALSLSLLWWPRRSRVVKWLTGPVAQSAIAAAIVLVCMAYELMLRRVWKPAGLALVADTMLHDIVPLLYVTYWTIYIAGARLRWSDTLRWLLYPGAYLVYALGRGLLTGQYPYHFLDLTTIGYFRAAGNIAMLLALMLLIGATLIAVDRWSPFGSGTNARSNRY
jgi:hypothetical protein